MEHMGARQSDTATLCQIQLRKDIMHKPQLACTSSSLPWQLHLVSIMHCICQCMRILCDV